MPQNNPNHSFADDRILISFHPFKMPCISDRGIEAFIPDLLAGYHHDIGNPLYHKENDECFV